ncbi:MAG: hypothetical protein AAGF84_04660 [Planctomycetota bacterium]
MEGSVGFGNAIALDGDHIAVADVMGRSPVYVFDTQTAELIQRLGPTDNIFNSSKPIDIDGDYVIAGLNSETVVFDVRTGDEVIRFTPDEPSEYSSFGFRVGLDNDRALVQARTNSFGPTEYEIILFDAVSGQRIKALELASLSGPNTWFAIDGNDIVVNGSAGSRPRVFDAATGELRFEIDNVSFFTHIGVGVSDGTALLGSPFSSIDGMLSSGAAFLYDLANQSEIGQLSPDLPQSSDRFGLQVDIDGDLAVVGVAPSNVPLAQERAAYVFDITTGEQLAKLLPGSGTPEDNEQFAYQVKIDGSTVAVSSRLDTQDSASGAVYLYDLVSILALAGDFDGDRIVAQGDLNLVLNNWGTVRGDWANADRFASETVDQEELNAVLNNWGSSASPSFASRDIPEPVAALGLFLFTGVQRRRSGRGL